MKNHTLLKPETQKEMLERQAIIFTAKNTGYGYGFFIEKTKFDNFSEQSNLT